MLRITTASAPTVRLRCTRPNQQQRSVDRTSAQSNAAPCSADSSTNTTKQLHELNRILKPLSRSRVPKRHRPANTKKNCTRGSGTSTRAAWAGLWVH